MNLNSKHVRLRAFGAVVLGCLFAVTAYGQSPVARDLVGNAAQLARHGFQLMEVTQQLEKISQQSRDANESILVAFATMKVGTAALNISFAGELVGVSQFIAFEHRSSYYPHLVARLGKATPFVSEAISVSAELRGKIREPRAVRLLNDAESLMQLSIKIIDRSAGVIRVYTPER